MVSKDPDLQCSGLPPMFIGAHRSARCPPMEEGARAHHSYGSYAPSTYGSYEPHRANPSTADLLPLQNNCASATRAGWPCSNDVAKGERLVKDLYE
jgi:hypothetical protein